MFLCSKVNCFKEPEAVNHCEKNVYNYCTKIFLILFLSIIMHYISSYSTQRQFFFAQRQYIIAFISAHRSKTIENEYER